MSPCDCFQAGAEEMGGFTKEVLMTWKVLVVEGERCTVPKAGKKGLNKKLKIAVFTWIYCTIQCVLMFPSGGIEGLKSLVGKTQVGVKV